MGNSDEVKPKEINENNENNEDNEEEQEETIRVKFFCGYVFKFNDHNKYLSFLR